MLNYHTANSYSTSHCKIQTPTLICQIVHKPAMTETSVLKLRRIESNHIESVCMVFSKTLSPLYTIDNPEPVTSFTKNDLRQCVINRINI